MYHIFERKTNNSVEMNFIQNRFLVLIRHELLKIYEFVMSYKSMLKKCNRAGDNNSIRKLRSLFNDVVDEFEGEMFAKIRNKILGHYVSDEYETAFEKAASSNKRFNYLVGDYIGENVFSFVDEIVVDHFSEVDLIDGKNIWDYVRDEMVTYRFKLMTCVHIYIRETLEFANIERKTLHEFARSGSFSQRGSTEIPVLVARMEK